MRRFLVDAQLPPALARKIAGLGHEAAHVLDVGLLKCSDSQIWDYAMANKAIILTKDEDFAIRASVKLWVDADACPAAIKDILFRVAERTRLPLTLVANRLLRVPPSPYIHALQVPMGFDVANAHIVERVATGDLVITAETSPWRRR